MYNLAAAELDYKGENPARGVKAYRETSRDRFLMPDELPRFFQALDSEPNLIMQTFFIVALFTGARRGNVCSMRWDQIDLANSQWRIPDTKRGEPQVVPLLPAALDALLAIRNKAVDGWVFPARNRRNHDCPHLTDPMPAWRRLLKRAGLKGLRIHDLRRTAGSYMAITGTSLQIIGRALGHTQVQTTAIYSRLTNQSVRSAMEQGADAMLSAGGVKLLEHSAHEASAVKEP
jgi:integrase